MYQNYYQNNYIPRSQVNPDERIWVQNEAAAEAYLVAPGGFVRLWDSNCNKFYERASDQSGRLYPTRVFEYKELTSKPNDEMSSLLARIERLEEKINVSESHANDTAIQSV